jgi:pimeloyl-ACP methyl ester carboxylesterase
MTASDAAPRSAPLALDRVGHGPPLVLLHPLGADRRVWDPVVARLRDHRELIGIDLPGFGESPVLSGVPTPRALAAAVAAQVRALGVERAHVAGNSLGGWIALELGLAGAARTVTGIAPAGLWPGPLAPKPVIAHKLAGALMPVIGPLARSRVGRRLLLSSTVAHPAAIPGPDASHLVRAYGSAPGFEAVNDQMRAGVFTGLERIRVPVTLVWPQRDRLVSRPPWLPDNVRNVTLEDAGHVPMWDDPDAVAEILLAATAEPSAVRSVASLRRSA